MSTFTYLITGASRSLGHGYAQALLRSSPSVRVVAAARNPDSASQLHKLVEEFGKERVYLLQLDVSDKESVEKARSELEGSGWRGEGGVDALVNNAGVAKGPTPPSALDFDEVQYNFDVNVRGVLNVNKAFLPLVKKSKGKQIFAVSSTCGSITEWGTNTMATAYCMSKVALNMYMKKLSVELADDGFTVIMFHPGYVKTDMNRSEDGTVSGELTTDEAVEAALKYVFTRVQQSDNGKFLRYSGEEMPW
ncbi:hypothetical protein JCM8547_005413 [Rhodosporidiobolus lusitaniae]